MIEKKSRVKHEFNYIWNKENTLNLLKCIYNCVTAVNNLIFSQNVSSGSKEADVGQKKKFKIIDTL